MNLDQPPEPRLSAARAAIMERSLTAAWREPPPRAPRVEAALVVLFGLGHVVWGVAVVLT